MNMAADGWVSSKDVFKISFLQFIAAVLAALFSNYLSSDVSFISNPTRSVKTFCAIFSLVCFSLLRLKSKVKFTVIMQVLYIIILCSIKETNLEKKKLNSKSIIASKLQISWLVVISPHMILQVFELILAVLLFSIIFHIMAILYGAPLSENSEETFCWALLVSILTTVPSCSLLGVELDLVPRICFSTWSDASPESYFQHVVALTVMGTWVGAFPIPLDWDRPWQVWPIPCVVGAIAGYIVGLGTSAVMFAVSERRWQDETKLI